MWRAPVMRRFFSIHNYMKTFPPEAVVRRHGRIRVDEYSSLKDSKRQLNRLEKEEREIYGRMKGKWQHLTDSYFDVVRNRQDVRLQSPAQQYDHYEYFTKVAWLEEREYTTLHRRKKQSQQEQLVLDMMQLPLIRKYYKTAELVKVCFNDSQTTIGFGVDLHNNETVRYMFRDLNSGATLTERFEGARVKNLVFFDETSIIYVTEDSKRRPSKVYWKRLGEEAATLLLEESNDQYYVDLHQSKDKKYVMITGSTKTNHQVSFIRKQSGQPKVERLFSKDVKARCSVNSSEGVFYLLTDADGSHDYKVMKQQNANSPRQDFYVPQEGMSVYEFDIFKNYLLLYLKSVSKSIVRVIDLQTKQTHQIDFGIEVGTILPGANEGYDIDEVVMFANTPFLYNVAYRYNISKRQLKKIQQPRLTGLKFDQSQYKAHIVEAQSSTGDLIPITILESRNRKGPAKMLLHVYGFYGMGNEVHYNNVYVRALEKGWVIAYAHVRGGNEKGNTWWKQGTLENKSRAWRDLHQCVAYLIKQQYTHPALLVLHGSSAGAITVWNEINRNPNLYKAAVLIYPFLDVLSTLLDDKLPLSISDYAQFGNPNDNPTTYNRIESYCPYQTIRAQEYPALYIQAGKNDYRCPLYQVLKFSSRFRDRASQPKRFLPLTSKGLMLNIQQHGSHLGITDQQQSIRQICEMFGYLDHIIDQANRDSTYS